MTLLLFFFFVFEEEAVAADVSTVAVEKEGMFVLDMFRPEEEEMVRWPNNDSIIINVLFVGPRVVVATMPS